MGVYFIRICFVCIKIIINLIGTPRLTFPHSISKALSDIYQPKSIIHLMKHVLYNKF